MKAAFDRIKKKYGEKFAKLCRSIFPELMEDDNFLPDLIEKNFAPSRFLYDDLEATARLHDFKYYIYSKIDDYKDHVIDIDETPEMLMERAGYRLYRCNTNEEVHAFKHYWREDEELCTFNDPERVHTHRVFFAVKEGAEDLKREDFIYPKRQDQYGVSVISIQFSQGPGSTVSIKNRYNHTVNDPDATFSNDLENIYPGLTDSFAKYYGIDYVNKTRGFEIPGYVMANDGRFYKYNHEIDNVYFCPNNIVIDNGRPVQYDKGRYEIIDYFVFDKSEKKIMLPSESAKGFLLETWDDAFLDAFYEKPRNQGTSESIIQGVDIKSLDNGERMITIATGQDHPVEIKVDKFNRIIGYTNENIIRINHHFMRRNDSLLDLNIPNVTEVGDYFLTENNTLTELYMYRTTAVGHYCLSSNKSLKRIDFTSLQSTGRSFMSGHDTLVEIDLPLLTTMGEACFWGARSLKIFNAPLLERMGGSCFYHNIAMEEIDLPSLRYVGPLLLHNNRRIKRINAPLIRQMPHGTKDNVKWALNNNSGINYQF